MSVQPVQVGIGLAESVPPPCAISTIIKSPKAIPVGFVIVIEVPVLVDVVATPR